MKRKVRVFPFSVSIALIHSFIVASEYFCNLDANLLRLDHLQRPELNKGTVDFAVPEEYWAPHPPPRIAPLYQPVIPSTETGSRKPQSMDYVFVIDVSVEAIRSGFTSTACESLRRILYGGTSEEDTIVCFPSQSRICIVTYDRTLHFYNLSVRIHCRVRAQITDSLVSSHVLSTQRSSSCQTLTMSLYRY